MSLLRTIGIILFVVGLVGLFVPGIPGGEFIRYAVVIGIVLLVVELFTGRRG